MLNSLYKNSQNLLKTSSRGFQERGALNASPRVLATASQTNLAFSLAYYSAQRKPGLPNNASSPIFGATTSHKLLSSFEQNIQKRNFWGLPKRQKELETKANENPNDAQLQAKLLQELFKTKPEEVIKRFESRDYAMNEEAERLYILSLVKKNKYDHSKVLSILRERYGDKEGGQKYQSYAQDKGSRTVIIQKTLFERLWEFALSPWVLFLAVIAGLIYIPKGGNGVEDLFQVPKAHELVTKVNTKFEDVKGIEEAKEELLEVVEFLKNRHAFAKFGAKMPKGILLVGPPGTGKTLMARAIAGEAGVPFLYVSGSAFDEVFVGVGSKRVRQLFEDARKLSPCIIFIDEIDSIGSKRSKYSLGSTRDSTLNQLLTEIDGFQPSSGVILIAATNFPESLDQALTRPGRFDKQITVPLPDVKGRKQILDLYLAKTKVAPEVDSTLVARGIPGFTGADIANLVNLSAIKAVLRGKPAVDMRIIEEAKDDILMGVKRKTQQTKENLKMTAYHEGGHALVAYYTPGANPVHKLTVIQRGQALGVTVQLPEDDQLSVSKKQMLARLAVSMGGKAAEELIYGDENVTSGASSDLMQATKLAKAMVTKWGMSDRVGHVWHDEEHMSENEKQLIDTEVRKLLQERYDFAQRVLKEHQKELHVLADALLEHETLSGDEMKDIIEGKKLPKVFDSSEDKGQSPKPQPQL